MGEILRVNRLRPRAVLPQRATAGASALDLHACLEGEALVLGKDPVLVTTGIALEIPPGLDVQVRPRSGLFRQGVAVALGTIDSDYRGEVLVTMYLIGARDQYEVHHGDRIAQLVIGRLAEVPVVEVEELSSTEREGGGHGSTGV